MIAHGGDIGQDPGLQRREFSSGQRKAAEVKTRRGHVWVQGFRSRPHVSARCAHTRGSRSGELP
eukprot:1146228-Pyramimonas_sp.AAC.1